MARIPGSERKPVDIKGCNTPTFDGRNRKRNILVEKAPVPPACDKVGAGPCGFTASGVGKGGPAQAPGAPVAPVKPGAPGRSGPGAPGAPVKKGAAPGTTTGQAPGQATVPTEAVDPEAAGPVEGGEAVAAAGGSELSGNVTNLGGARTSDSMIGVLAAVAALLLFALLFTPAVVGSIVRRGRKDA